MEKKYDVFISYSRNDYVDEQKNVIPGNEVSKVKDALTKAGITYWFDEDGIYSGQNFVERIVTNIENATIFLFLSTANSNNSQWTCKEIASADEFKKHIIPVRIDATPYNKKVLFRIADLNYIDYYTNPQRGIENMIESIKTYLDELADKEKRKKEEEDKKKELDRQKKEELKRQKELEERHKQEEQERIVSKIKKSCTALNNEEAKLELDRKTLCLEVEDVSDNAQRDSLICLIKTGGAIHQKYQKECSELEKKLKTLENVNSELEKQLKNRDKQILQLKSDINSSSFQEEKQQKTIQDLCGQIDDLKKQLSDFQIQSEGNGHKRNKKNKIIVLTHIFYWIIIIICIFVLGIIFLRYNWVL